MKVAALNIFTVLLLLLTQQKDVESVTRVKLYFYPNYFLGISLTPPGNLDAYSYYSLGEVSSFQILTGSCVEMHKSNPSYPSPSSWYWSSSLENYSMRNGFNNRVAYVKKCGSYKKSISCPEGTFVKKIKWDRSNMLRDGIELYCGHANGSFSTSQRILRSHGSVSLYGSTECSSAVRGIHYSYDSRRLAMVGITPSCTSVSDSANVLVCGAGKMITGMDLTIENNSGFIKAFDLECRDIQADDIASTCVASDKRSVLFTCDSSQASFPLKCAHEKIVGYGLTKTLTEELRKEYEFHRELGFDFGYAGFGLSGNFRETLGYSETTSYSWTETQESTFHSETKVSVEAEAPAGYITKVSEIIGECSFMQVRPNYFQRHDNCSGMEFTTHVVIPENFRSRVFVSKVPEAVANYLKLKTGNSTEPRNV